jgi:hypothetical protein
MKRVQIVIVAIAFLAATSSALAQPPASSAASAPDPQRLQLAREVMQANGGVEAYQARLKSFFGTVAKLAQDNVLAASSPQASALANGLLAHFQQEELKSAAAILDDTATVYAEHLTTQELNDLLAWTKSKSARSILAKQAAMSEEMARRQGPLLKRMTSGAAKEAVERTCKENHCTAEERQNLNAIAEKIAPGA